MLDETAWPGILRLVAVLGGSVLLSLGVVALTRVVALKLRFTDYPNPNTQNSGGAALGGGVGVVVTILLMFWLVPDQAGVQMRIGMLIAALCALGLLDDLFKLTPLVKVLGQTACAALYVLGGSFDGAAAAAAILFLILTSNAWNVVDVMDALLASIGTLALFGGCVVMLLHGLSPHGLPIIPAIAAGAVAGFLVLNRPPARIILGDAGSLPLGMLYGALVLEAFAQSPSLAITVCLPGLIPLLEVGFLLVQRSRRGIPFYHPTPDHFALRLVHNGYTIGQVIAPVVWSGIGLIVFASLLEFTSFHIIPILIVVVLLAVAVTWAYRFVIRLRVGGTMHVRHTE